MEDDLISLFRLVEVEDEEQQKNNVVIEDQDGKKLETLCQEFTKRKTEGKPLVYCDK